MNRHTPVVRPDIQTDDLGPNADTLRQVARDFGTPCWLYNAGEIRRRVASLGDFDAPLCGLAVIEELCGRRTQAVDPFGAHLDRACQALQRHQANIIETAARLVRDVPRQR
ncbi:hypothetical protein [Roseibium sp.]|uniref:hypothetical protein n=1 Tax=Roseibium sp. TaxID=1936156 RepID=UPI003A969A32